MKIYVDMDKCQHYGQCTFEAPTVFALNDDGKLEYVGDVDDALACVSQRSQLPLQRTRDQIIVFLEEDTHLRSHLLSAASKIFVIMMRLVSPSFWSAWCR